MRCSNVYYQDQLAGRLWDDGLNVYHFVYHPTFVTGDFPPITPNLPKRLEQYDSPHLFPVFYAMLAEGDLRALQEQTWKIEAGDDFGLLRAAGRHDTIGALTLQDTVFYDEV